MSFVILDLKEWFTLSEAAFAWVYCEESSRKAQFIEKAVLESLVRDAIDNELQLAEDSSYGLISSENQADWNSCKVHREELKRWAKAILDRPPFLFKDLRDNETEPQMKEQFPRWEAFRRERCRVVARMLWAREPNLKPAEIIEREEMHVFGCEGDVPHSRSLRRYLEGLSPPD